MSDKAIVVKDDSVSGTDTHSVTYTSGGNPGSGTAKYQWDGKAKADTAPFFTIGGKAVVTVADQADINSAHDPNQPTGAPPPTFDPGTMQFAPPPPDGHAKPSSGAGSTFFKVAGEFVLLDGDKFDGCTNAVAASGNLSVAASQSFFTIKE